MTITVLLFASYRTACGWRESTLDVQAGSTARDVAARLEAEHDGLVLKGALCAVNEAYAAPDRALREGDVVAFFPPVSGGSGDGEPGDGVRFDVTTEPLDLDAHVAFVTLPECGAVAVFLGTVRSPNAGEAVRSIDYEGYEGMILAQMRVATDEVRARHDLRRVAVSHRLGRLAPAEASIAIAVSSPHRRAALDGVSELLDRLKELLPVWKYERGEGSDEEPGRWVAGSSAASEPL